MTIPRGVIFDFDGVLIDSFKIHDEIKFGIARQLGINYSKLKSDGRASMELFRELQLPTEVVNEYIRLWQKAEKKATPKIFSGVNHLLSELIRRDIATGIVTNRSPDSHFKWILKHCGLNISLLNFIITYNPQPQKMWLRLFTFREILMPRLIYTTPYSKPDPRILESIPYNLSILLKDHNSIWYIGDSLLDLEFTKKSGLNFVGVLTGVVNDPTIWISHDVNYVLGVSSLLSFILKE